MSKSGYLFLLFLGLLSFKSQAVPNDSEIDSLLKQQIIGTQAIGAKYHFTSDDPVVEQAKKFWIWVLK